MTPEDISNLMNESEGFHDEDVFGNIYDDIRKLIVTGKRDPELEKELINFVDPYYAFYYAADVIKGRWPEAEETIKTDPKVAVYYAADVIRGRWPEAEEIIKQNPFAACRYARDVIRGRWPEAEEIIKQDRGSWNIYKHIQESIIIDESGGMHDKDVFGNLEDVIGHMGWAGEPRNPQIEQEILNMTGPLAGYFAYIYALRVIRGRWPEAEELIKKDRTWAYYYADHVIRGPWPGEAVKEQIDNMHDEDVFGDIIDEIFKLAETGKRDPELEKEVLYTQDPYAANLYAVNVMGRRWPEAEEIIKKNPFVAYHYAREIVKGRWPEAEEIIKKDGEWWDLYKEQFGIQESIAEPEGMHDKDEFGRGDHRCLMYDMHCDGCGYCAQFWKWTGVCKNNNEHTACPQCGRCYNDQFDEVCNV